MKQIFEISNSVQQKSKDNTFTTATLTLKLNFIFNHFLHF